MICFRGMTFCGAFSDSHAANDCTNTECNRYLSKNDYDAALEWAKGHPALIASADLSKDCKDYQPAIGGEG